MHFRGFSRIGSIDGYIYYQLSTEYLDADPPDYNKAKTAIEKAVKNDPDNLDYLNLQSQIIENITVIEEQKNPGVFRRLRNRLNIF